VLSYGKNLEKMLRDSIQLEMHFSLKKLVASHNLQQPDQPFTQEDIAEEVKHLASDKAPGPDGFNGAFLKKCWSIIKQDIYQLCLDFFNNLGGIQCINNAFITLVPKVNRAGGVKPEDHRVGVPVQEVEGRRSKAKGGEDHPRRNDPVL
jgi:hypothetical protein